MIVRGRPPAPHGTPGRYKSNKYKCRCQECQAAMAADRADRKAARFEQTKDPNDPRHGKRSFYTNYGCRCDRCTEANNDYFKGGKDG